MRNDAPHSDQKTTPATPAPKSLGRSQPPRVLFIDDDPDFSLAVKLRLESYGIAVVRAFNGLDGYHTALGHRVGAILLDYEMPNGQGDYVLRRLRENPLTCDVPVIVITGRDEAALRRKMLNLGANAFLGKPLVFSDLLRELSRHVDVLPAAAAH